MKNPIADKRTGILVLFAVAACADGETGRTSGPATPATSITTTSETGADTTGDGGTTSDSTTGAGSSDTDGDPSGGTTSPDSTSTTTTTTGGGPKFDLGEVPDSPTDDSGGGCGTECMCTIPEHAPCDNGTSDLFQAMGLNCPGELQVQTSNMGPTTAMTVRSSFGGTNTFDPREGSVYAVLGSGLVGELDSETPAADGGLFGHASPTYCNDDLGAFDPGGTLPAPLVPSDVGGQDCSQDPNLVGMGDCSNTIQGQFDQGNSANDYVELRFSVDVPSDVVSFSYDFAFFSTEYPFYYGSAFNDMYVGWLESENWTGNISFDQTGNPISLNAGFLDFQDDGGNLPEFAGTCMKYHAGTNWLTTTTGVTPGETITVVFAIFDLSDSILDSYVFLDNFEWGCEPSDGPSTEPEG